MASGLLRELVIDGVAVLGAFLLEQLERTLPDLLASPGKAGHDLPGLLGRRSLSSATTLVPDFPYPHRISRRAMSSVYGGETNVRLPPG